MAIRQLQPAQTYLVQKVHFTSQKKPPPLKKLKKHGFIFFANLKKLQKHEFNFLQALKKAQKT